ncbi:MAG: SRPBCC domain-containing protein [Chloroflexota bacterium]
MKGSEISYENGRLTVTRIFNAPREAVFEAWVETSKVQLWWGCAYATQVQSEIEPEVGGKFNHLMTLKDVGDYQQKGMITAYDPPALLAYDLYDGFNQEPMPVRVEFHVDAQGTRVRLTQDNLPDSYSQYVKVGWLAGFEKLSEILEAETAVS